VVVSGGRISRIVPTVPGLSLPRAAREIDAPGRTLLPGLIDAHVHVTGWTLPLFLRYGVTTVRDLHNDPSYILPLTRDDGPIGRESWRRSAARRDRQFLAARD
jgi:predicted amidohydrolase YtcJ